MIIRNKVDYRPFLLLTTYFQPNAQIVEEETPKATNNPTSTTDASSRSTAAESHQPENDEPAGRHPGCSVVRSAACPAPPHGHTLPHWR